MLDRRDVVARFEQARRCPGIEPGDATPELLHPQFAPREVLQIQIRDFDLAASRRFQLPTKFHYSIVENVKSGHSELAPRMLRFFFEADRLAGIVEFHDTITLWIAHLITENAGAALERQRLAVEIEFPVKAVVAHT